MDVLNWWKVTLKAFVMLQNMTFSKQNKMKKKKYYAAQLLIKIDNNVPKKKFPEQLFFLGTFIIR